MLSTATVSGKIGEMTSKRQTTSRCSKCGSRTHNSDCSRCFMRRDEQQQQQSAYVAMGEVGLEPTPATGGGR